MLQNEQQHVYDKVLDIITELLEPKYFDFDLQTYMVSLSGSAGTGKTFLTSKIIEHFVNQKYKVSVTTPTHKSLNVIKEKIDVQSNKIEFRTIHSFLGLKMEINYDSGQQKLEMDKYAKDQNSCDLLVIDESSMISREMLEHIEKILRVRAKAVLFVGDFYQLKPVEGEVSNIQHIPQSFELKNVQRQSKNSPIIKKSLNIRDRIITKEYDNISTVFMDIDDYAPNIIDIDNKRDLIKTYINSDKEKMIIVYTNKRVDLYNQIIRKMLYPNSEPFVPAEHLIFQSNLMEERRGSQTIKILNGSKVEIQDVEKTENKNIGVIWNITTTENQTFSVVEGEAKERVTMMLDVLKNDALKEYNKSKRKEKWQMFYSLKFKFADVKYAYATTIHKMQGSTVDEVYFDMNDMYFFDSAEDRDTLYRLVYVAVTRPRYNVFVHR